MGKIQEFCQRHGIEEKLLKAVIAVEAGGNGFNQDGSLKIRFEAHLVLDAHPNLSRWFALGNVRYLDHFYKFPSYSTLWRRLHTGNQWDEYTALLVAGFQIQNEAFRFCSMGKFQLMGFHFKKLGFDSAIQMFSFMSQSDENDTETGLRFIAADWNLIDSLQKKDLRRFAVGYNGSAQPDYYVTRFLQEYNRL